MQIQTNETRHTHHTQSTRQSLQFSLKPKGNTCSLFFSSISICIPGTPFVPDPPPFSVQFLRPFGQNQTNRTEQTGGGTLRKTP